MESRHNHLQFLDYVAKACLDLAEKIEDINMKGEFPLILGSETIGTLGVIWFDAHGNLNMTKTTPSGNFVLFRLYCLIPFSFKFFFGVVGYACICP